MNRQLKFRAWTEKWGMVYPDKEFSIDVHARTVWKDSCCEEESQLMQFTGLQDSTGRDIYEGDIIKTDPNHFTALLQIRKESEEYTEYTKGEVRWWNEGFAVCQENIGATRISEYASCHCCPCGLTIIGNIFETPKESTL